MSRVEVLALMLPVHPSQSSVQMFEAIYRLPNEVLPKYKEEAFAQWRAALDNGGWMDARLHFEGPAGTKETVQCTPWEYMLLTWDLAYLAKAVLVMGKEAIEKHTTQENLAHHIAVVRQRRQSGQLAVAGHGMHGKVAEYMHELGWRICPLPCPAPNIAPWHVLWFRDFDVSLDEAQTHVSVLRKHLPLMTGSDMELVEHMRRRSTMLESHNQRIFATKHVSLGSVVVVAGCDPTDDPSRYEALLKTLDPTHQSFIQRVCLGEAVAEQICGAQANSSKKQAKKI